MKTKSTTNNNKNEKKNKKWNVIKIFTSDNVLVTN